MKKIKYIIILFLLFIGINSVLAFDTTKKVYDYANVLSESEEENLKEKALEFIGKYNMDMALVTVKHHEKSTTQAYAQDFYDYNGFGVGDDSSGILFVIDFTFGYRDIYMTTTGSAINMYNDYRIEKILDSVAEEKDETYYNWFNAFIISSTDYASMGIPKSEVIETKKNYIPLIMATLVLPTIVVLILIFKNRMIRKSVDANYYIKENSVIINNRNDSFITTHTTSVRISEPNSSNGSGGGSSISHGSSGVSHGGGGRRL